MRVLIADDDRVFAELTATRLRARGFDVSIAYDAPTAHMTALRFTPAVILLDIRMPGGSGLDTLKRLKANLRTEPIPVIVITGTQDPAAGDHARENGAAGFLHKPVEADVLNVEIRRVLGLPAEDGPAPAGGEQLGSG
jgi:DNA-binding response OmpR family regulator